MAASSGAGLCLVVAARRRFALRRRHAGGEMWAIFRAPRRCRNIRGELLTGELWAPTGLVPGLGTPCRAGAAEAEAVARAPARANGRSRSARRLPSQKGAEGMPVVGRPDRAQGKITVRRTRGESSRFKGETPYALVGRE